MVTKAISTRPVSAVHDVFNISVASFSQTKSARTRMYFQFCIPDIKQLTGPIRNWHMSQNRALKMLAVLITQTFQEDEHNTASP